MEDGKFYWRYFRVTCPDFDAKMHEMNAARIEHAKLMAELAKEFGAHTIYTWAHDGSFAGFFFEEDPDPKVYRKSKDMWVPKMNSKVGKAIHARMASLPTLRNINSILEDYGLEHGVPRYVEDGQPCYATVSGFYDDHIWFVKVPSRHFCDAVLEAHKEILETTGFSDKSLWQPPAAWLEIKQWEFVREWDELELKNSQ